MQIVTTEQFLAGNDLLAWRRRQLRRGGRSVDLDWLLDLGGSCSRTTGSNPPSNGLGM